MPTPAAPAVLCTPDSIKPGQKGGTLIAESVCNAKEHRRLLESGGYRPEGCPHCGGLPPHPGQTSPRATGPLGLDDARADLRLSLSAVRRRLAGASQLHRPPSPQAVGCGADGDRCRPPESYRIASAQIAPAQHGAPLAQTPGILSEAGAWSTRADMVDVLARMDVVGEECKYQALAGWIHRIVPGLRLV